MLKPLSKKLNSIFITTIMLIITTIMIILCKNYIHMEQSSEVILFQRMVTQMMYQLEDNSQNFASIADSYHEYKSPIFCYIQDTSGKVVYQTDSGFPTDANTLLERFRTQTDKEDTFIITNDNKPATDQSGVFMFNGTKNDGYLGILAPGVIHFSVIRFVKAFVYWAFWVFRCQGFCSLTHD